MLKRIILLFAVSLFVAAMLLASTVPAFAIGGPANDENIGGLANDENASCLGAAGSRSATLDPGYTGKSRSYYAHQDLGRVNQFAKWKIPTCRFLPAP